MNTGTFYLYEYENYKRKRNVGFIKVSRHYQSCILQIQARGIPVRNGSTLTLSAFYCKQDKLIISKVADLTSCGRNISIRLSVSETHFPERRSLQQIDGFLLQNPDKGASPFFWMASSFFFDIRPDMMQTEEPEAESVSEAEPTSEAETISEPKPTLEAEVPGSKTVSEAEPTAKSETASQPEITPESPPAINAETISAPADGLTPEPALQSAETANLPQAKKISREDLTLLPRKFWPLANNSFLLHGYHNYNHLVLIEENGRRWLGVPGIYDTREARAADLFGFPRFTRAYVSVLELTDEERNDTADFGHWCRCVGTCSPAGNASASFSPEDRLK